LKPGFVQVEKDLVKQNATGFVAGGLEHEVRPVFAQQLSGVVNQITLHGSGTQIYGGISHEFFLGIGGKGCDDGSLMCSCCQYVQFLLLTITGVGDFIDGDRIGEWVGFSFKACKDSGRSSTQLRGCPPQIFKAIYPSNARQSSANHSHLESRLSSSCKSLSLKQRQFAPDRAAVHALGQCNFAVLQRQDTLVLAFLMFCAFILTYSPGFPWHIPSASQNEKK